MNLSNDEALFHLKRLKKLGFVNLGENQTSFTLTQRVKFFKQGFDIKKKEYKINKILDMLQIFSNLKKKN